MFTKNKQNDDNLKGTFESVDYNYPNRTTYMDLSLPKILIKTGKGYRFINFDAIMYCRAAGSYAEIFIYPNEKFTTSKKLKEVASILPSNFIRTHRSCIVNLQYATEIHCKDGLWITMSNGEDVPITKDCKKIILSQYPVF